MPEGKAMAHDIVTLIILAAGILTVPALILGDVLEARRFRRDMEARRADIRAEYDAARAAVRAGKSAR
jgi:hypothetical protein